MEQSFLMPSPHSKVRSKKGFKELAMFGLRKAFIDPAPKPKPPCSRMDRFFSDPMHFLPE